MRILITGSKGQLGNELQRIIRDGYSEIGEVSENIKSSEVFPLDIDELDITKLDSVKSVLNRIKPDVVINCAAATNVDGCENNNFLFKREERKILSYNQRNAIK